MALDTSTIGDLTSQNVYLSTQKLKTSIETGKFRPPYLEKKEPAKWPTDILFEKTSQSLKTDSIKEYGGDNTPSSLNLHIEPVNEVSANHEQSMLPNSPANSRTPVIKAAQ